MGSDQARRSAAILTLANLAGQLLGFAYRIALSRTIGPEGMGLFQLIFPFQSLAMALAVSGLCVAVSRMAAEYRALGDEGALGALVGRAMLLFCGFFGMIAAGSILFARQIAAGFLGDARTERAVWLLLPVVFFTGIENLHKNYLYGIGDVGAPAFSDVAEQLVRMGSVLLLLRTVPCRGPGEMLGLIVLGMGICEAASTLFLRLVYCRKRRGLAGRRTGSGGKMLRMLLRTAIPVSAANLVNNLLSALIVVLIPRRLELSGLSHARALEEYGVLFGMTMPLLLLPASLVFGVGLVMVPRLSSAAALGDRAAVQRAIARGISAVSTLVLPVLAVLVPLGSTAVRLLYGAEVSGGMLLPLAAGVALSIYMGLLGSVLNGLGRPGAAALGAISGNALELALTWLLVADPRLRLRGYVIAFLASVVLTAGSNLAFAVRACGLRIRPGRWFFLPLLNSIGAALTARLILLRSAQRLGEGGAMIVAILGAAAVYLGFLALERGCSGSEKQQKIDAGRE